MDLLLQTLFTIGKYMIDIRPLLILLYISFCLLHYNKFVPIIKDIFPKKWLDLIDSSRFFGWWGMFLDEGDITFDIHIKAKTDKDEYLWSLRYDKKICNIKISNVISRITLTFYYEQNNYFFLNPYIHKKIDDYFISKKEKLKLLEIKKTYYNKYSKKEIINRNKCLYLFLK